jgi:hypothetical protein
VEGILKFLSVKFMARYGITGKKLLTALLCTVLWTSLYAQEETTEALDPADYLPREYAQVEVTRTTVPIRSFKTRVSAAVEMFYTPASDEAMITYRCVTNVFDLGDAQIACENYAQEFLLKNQQDAFLNRVQRGLQKPYYHFRIVKKPDLRFIKDVDPRKHESKYYIYIQFY